MTFGKDVSGKTYVIGFCQHHGNENYVELNRDGWMILDDQRGFRIEDPRGATSSTRSKKKTQELRPRPGEESDGDVDPGQQPAMS